MKQPMITHIPGFGAEAKPGSEINVIDTQIHNETLEFQTAEIPVDQADTYLDVPAETTAILAELDAGDGGNRFVVCRDKTAQEGDNPYFVMNARFVRADAGGKGQFRVSSHGTSLEPGQPFELNRTSMGDVALPYTKSGTFMSGKHATLGITAEGRLSITDHSTNATRVRYAEGQARSVVEQEAPVEPQPQEAIATGFGAEIDPATLTHLERGYLEAGRSSLDLIQKLMQVEDSPISVSTDKSGVSRISTGWLRTMAPGETAYRITHSDPRVESEVAVQVTGAIIDHDPVTGGSVINRLTVMVSDVERLGDSEYMGGIGNNRMELTLGIDDKTGKPKLITGIDGPRGAAQPVSGRDLGLEGRVREIPAAIKAISNSL